MSVKSSTTVFRVLRHLAAEAEPVSAGEVARVLSVPVTTAVRALATLEAAGYAERHYGTPGFVIGKSARTLAFAFMAQFPVRDLAMPYLQQLTLETSLTSSLFVRLGWYAVRIGLILGPNVLIQHASLGEARVLTMGAPSLAILAHLPDEANRLTHAPASACAEDLAVAPNLAEPSLVDVAAALLDRRERVIAAIAVEGVPTDQLRAIRDTNGAARSVMHDLAIKIRDERTMELSHYDHIDPDRISF